MFTGEFVFASITATINADAAAFDFFLPAFDVFKKCHGGDAKKNRDTRDCSDQETGRRFEAALRSAFQPKGTFCAATKTKAEAQG